MLVAAWLLCFRSLTKVPTLGTCRSDDTEYGMAGRGAQASDSSIRQSPENSATLVNGGREEIRSFILIAQHLELGSQMRLAGHLVEVERGLLHKPQPLEKSQKTWPSPPRGPPACSTGPAQNCHVSSGAFPPHAQQFKDLPHS